MIDQLAKELYRIADNMFRGPLGPIPSPMAKVSADIDTLFRGGGPKPSSDRIKEAVRSFRNTGELPSFNDTKLCCCGIVTHYDGTSSLLEERELFPLLIRKVEDLKTDPPKFRRCYQGLRDGYFRYSGYEMSEGSIGRTYWQELGRRLSSWLPVLEGNEFAQRWINTLRDHKNLLENDPCRRYGIALLRGDSEEYDVVCERLDLNEETWIPKMAVLGQMEMAANLADVEFKQKLNHLLALLCRYQIIKDQGLAALLTRYAKCVTHPPEHKGLFEMSVSLWGTPWMERNRAGWDARVKEPVRVMVTGWMKRRAIKDFFELLSGDGTTDPRRLKFWLRYADSIDDMGMAFALGRYAWKSNITDYVQFRRDNQGRCMKLEGAASGNNAFLMKIGDYIFVEFGENGNALYIYESNNMQISFAAQRIELSAIKQIERTAKRLRHADGNMKWEDKFAREIDGLVRIFPDR